jgi:uncharacterized protein involved in outer membrane biogenesis
MKKAGVVLVLGLVIAGTGVILAVYGLNVLVRVALEHWGPDVTGVKVDVQEVILSPFKGTGRITGLELGIPAGFSARSVHFGETLVRLEPATLFSDVTVINELSVQSLAVAYERGDKGSNLDAIQRSIEAYGKRSTSQPREGKSDAAESSKHRFVIDRLSIRKARVTMTTRGLKGQGLAFDLPDVELRDVGRKSGGVTASQAAAIVASTLQQKIALRVLTNVDALRRGGLEGAIDALRGLVK